MSLFKRVFDFYLQASIHVALAVYALVRITQHQFDIGYETPVAMFAFFGTIVGYNFVKYDALARVRQTGLRTKIKLIAIFSFVCFLVATWFFFALQFKTQLVSGAFLMLTALYTLPFFPNRRNARNWAGIKIYIVAFCWVGVTLLLPLLDAEVPLSLDVFIKCIQRFILVFVLILIFEIIDLSKDDPHLQTVPQQIGVKRTKILGLILLVPFYALEFVLVKSHPMQLVVNAVIVATIALFMLFANERKSKYYTSFWVEMVPVLWWILVLVFSN